MSEEFDLKFAKKFSMLRGKSRRRNNLTPGEYYVSHYQQIGSGTLLLLCSFTIIIFLDEAAGDYRHDYNPLLNF